MNALTFLLKHKWLVSGIVVLILVFVALSSILIKQDEEIQVSAQQTMEQQDRSQAFKSGSYQLSKGKSW